MNDTNKVAVALIKNNRGEYLLIRLAHYPDHIDEWCPVAGHIKGGETVEDTLIREVEEEIGADAKPISQITEWEQDIPGELALWWNVEITGQIKPNKEVAEFKYFSEKEIKNIKLWPATRKFFEKFIWNENL